MNFGLSEKTFDTMNAIFGKYKGILQVVLYGSRAKGNFKNGSDIDLTLKTNAAFTYKDFLNIYDDFVESDLPYFVDVSVYDDLSNKNLKEHIDRVGQVIFSTSSAETTAHLV